MRARWQLAAAARELKAFEQGDLDGLCGLYSIISAVRLAVYPRRLRKSDVRVLFEAGLGALGAARRLRRTITEGMEDELWVRTTDAVLAQAELDHGQRLVLIDLLATAKLQTVSDAHRLLKHELHSGLPIIVTLAGSYNHWTVFSSYTKSRYYLFDSAGFRWINTVSLALADDDHDVPHTLARALTLRPR